VDENCEDWVCEQKVGFVCILGHLLIVNGKNVKILGGSCGLLSKTLVLAWENWRKGHKNLIQVTV
jgi:hypothetical protein